MNINISGHHMNSGEALSNYIVERIDSHVTKYFQQPISADVKYEKDKRGFFGVKIKINEGTHQNMQFISEANGDNAYSAFISAFNKIEKQLRRFKRKVKSH